MNGVAVVFELVVNFGRNEDAVASAFEQLERHPAVEVRGAMLPVTPPSVTRFRRGDEVQYIEFSVHPRGLGYGGPGPSAPFHVRELSDAELLAVGEQLYDLLRGFRDYDVAIVGWDPELLVDIDELESDWVPDGSISTLQGLVLSDALADRWHPEGFVPFTSGHMGLPYRGTANLP